MPRLAMPRLTMPLPGRPYAWRDDPAVPAFPDDRPLVVFDGMCVLCSAFARFLLRHDRAGLFRLATAQGPLGQALFRHYGLDAVDFETNLVLDGGCAYARLAAFAAAVRRLPWPWRALAAAGWIPDPPASWLYDRIARNRYALFGRHAACVLPPPGTEDRFL